MILVMQNAVPAPEEDRPLALRAVDRAVARHQAAASDEVRRLLDAGLAVMRRTQSIDPRVSEMVREAGLSNQAFYRNFRSKEELLVAILDDGARTLVEYLRHQMAKATDPLDAVRRWIAGILTQAADRGAAERTRPFALNSLRLAHQFPEDSRRSAELLQAPLREALEGVAGADPVADADAIYQLAMGRTQAALVQRRRPSKDEIAHTCAFAVGGLRR